MSSSKEKLKRVPSSMGAVYSWQSHRTQLKQALHRLIVTSCQFRQSGCQHIVPIKRHFGTYAGNLSQPRKLEPQESTITTAKHYCGGRKLRLGFAIALCTRASNRPRKPHKAKRTGSKSVERSKSQGKILTTSQKPEAQEGSEF